MTATWTTPKTWAAAVLTSADMNTYVRNEFDYLKTNTAYGAAAALTVSGGIITKTQAYHKVAGESAAADDIDTISGGAEGEVLIIRPNGQAITLKDGTGNLDLNGDILLSSDDDHIALIFGSDSAWHPITAPRTSFTFLVNNFVCPAPGTDWTPELKGVTLGASLSAKKCWLPLPILKVGDIMTAYTLHGDAVEAAALTLDCKLVQVNLADPLTTTDITNGAIVQVTADGNFSVTVTPTATTATANKQYVLELLGTTGAGDSITVTGAGVVISRLG